MERIQRRAVLGAAASLAALLVPGRAHATLMRGLALQDLVSRSRHVLLLTGLDSQCRYLQIAGRRSIITETRVRVEDVVARATPGNAELVVRTLGGELAGEGELVHGQAEISANAACLAFLTCAPDGSLWVTGMAQGHYPLESAGASDVRLLASPHLPSIRDWERSAVRALTGQTLTDARRMITNVSRP